jgi:diacylglycerol kinase
MFNYLKKRVQSFGYAFKGLGDFFSGRHPHALIHLLAVVVVTAAGLFFKISATEWVVILLCFALVLSLEAMNSALEYLVDLASPEYHPLAGKAKDMAAAAVLIAAIISIIIAGVIFVPKFIS